jgi:type IV secretory pathway VirD2 relaxase
MPTTPFNDEEPKRIGRTRRGGGQRSQPLHVPGGSGRPESRGPTTFEQYACLQRVVVKTHIVRHRSSQKGRASITRHVRYLTREAVTRDVGSGRFYDANRDDLDARKETREWAEDRHHARLIVSPENAHSLNDFKAYIREVRARVERDLGPLQWIAVNHTK